MIDYQYVGLIPNYHQVTKKNASRRPYRVHSGRVESRLEVPDTVHGINIAWHLARGAQPP